MKNGKCPKCNSTNVFKNQRGLDWGKSAWVEIWFGNPEDRTNAYSDYDSYICTDCGYFENYVLKKKYSRKSGPNGPRLHSRHRPIGSFILSGKSIPVTASPLFP